MTGVTGLVRFSVPTTGSGKRISNIGLTWRVAPLQVEALKEVNPASVSACGHNLHGKVHIGLVISKQTDPLAFNEAKNFSAAVHHSKHFQLCGGIIEFSRNHFPRLKGNRLAMLQQDSTHTRVATITYDVKGIIRPPIRQVQD